jgi:O-antigen biosynthesis protein
MKILWIALVWPEPDSSAAGLRTRQLLEALQELDYEVRVCSPCSSNSYQENLEEIGITTVILQPNDPAFDDYLIQYQPDIVFFDRFIAEEQFGWRVRQSCPNAIRIIDTIDLHLLRKIREKLTKNSNSDTINTFNDLPEHLLHFDYAYRELAAIYRSDLSLIVSNAEIKILQDNYQIKPELLYYCNLWYDINKSCNTFDLRKNFIFIGNFNHQPNLDACRVLADGLWSKIRCKLEKLGNFGCELHIYGAYTNHVIHRLADNNIGIKVLDRVIDSAKALALYRINLAPLRFGAGIKGKIAEGWSVGTPAIGTSIAAEGMTGTDSNGDKFFGGDISDNWEDFACKASILYTDSNLWLKAQERGFQIINDIFSRNNNKDAFYQALKSVTKNITKTRSNNFVGSILWRDSQRSVEYFSRWIELKSKINK